MIAVPTDHLAELIPDVAAQPAWRDVGAGLGHAGRLDQGWTGTWVAVLTPEGACTRIAVTERASVPNPLHRLIARVIFDRGDKVAQKLSCGPDHFLHLRALDGAGEGVQVPSGQNPRNSTC